MTRIKSSILTARFGASSKRRIFARYVVKLIKFHLTVLISREKRYVDYDLTKAVRGEADSATFIYFIYIYTQKRPVLLASHLQSHLSGSVWPKQNCQNNRGYTWLFRKGENQD